MLNKLRDHMMQLINRSQHGFIPGRSCTTQLIETLDHIGALLDSGKQIDIIFMDMSKAFDKVNHAALISKLQYYNIGGSLLIFMVNNSVSLLLVQPRPQKLLVQEFLREAY